MPRTHPRLVPLVQTGFTVERGKTTTPAARPINVLVADDSDSLRSLVRITLTSQGWSVREAATAEAALALTRETRPDLVILDITFGDTGPDGLAVCAELKAEDRKSTRLNSSHMSISYAVFCLKKKKK